MKRALTLGFPIFLLLAMAITIVSIANSQIVVPQPGGFTNTIQMVPGAVPTSNTCIAGFASTCIWVLPNANPGSPTSYNDPFLCAADFTATGQTITLKDANGNLWIVAGAALGSSGNPTGWSWISSSDATCRRFPGGVYVQAGGSGVSGSMTIKYNRGNSQ